MSNKTIISGMRRELKKIERLSLKGKAEPIDEIYLSYGQRAIDLTIEALEVLDGSNKALEALEALATTKLVKYKSGKLLPSNVSEYILSGKARTAFKANLEIAKSNQVYMQLKETLQLITTNIVIQSHADTRFKRETIKSKFMSDS